MTLQKHIILLIFTFLAWLGFYLLGIPSNYFTDWSLTEIILLSLFILLILFVLWGLWGLWRVWGMW